MSINDCTAMPIYSVGRPETKNHCTRCQIIPPHITEKLIEFQQSPAADAKAVRSAKFGARYAAVGGREAFANALQKTMEISDALTQARTEKVKQITIDPTILPSAPAAIPDPAAAVYNANHRAPNVINLTQFTLYDATTLATDASAKRALDNSLRTFAFYKNLFNRNSIDNRGMPLNSAVHYGKRYGNAAWTNEHVMIYGDGDGLVFDDFTNSFDVIGHELTHGVTEFTTNLQYQGQSGALNEHVSDVFGVVMSQYYNKQVKPREANWLVGREIILDDYRQMLFEDEPGHHCHALRSMKAPGTAYNCEELGRDPQPEVMSHFVNTTRDAGGVHINSGIPNKAFYLFSTALQDIPAWEAPLQVWYKTITSGTISPNATIAQFAKATLRASGQQPVAVQTALKWAWTQVQVMQ